jgi:hypothetical protein
LPPRITGAWLIAAAVLFWIGWLLMPGVGVTDAAQILSLVGTQRPEVRLSVIVQLASAACYAPAMVGMASLSWKRNRSAITLGAILLLIGAMGSAADAIFHLVAYEMTGPDAPSAPLIPIMTRLQGPDLVLIAPMLVSFFLGSIVLALAMALAGEIAVWNPALFVLALVVAFAGSRLFGADPNTQRIIGLAVLALISLSQAWLGYELWDSPNGRSRLT